MEFPTPTIFKKINNAGLILYMYHNEDHVQFNDLCYYLYKDQNKYYIIKITNGIFNIVSINGTIQYIYSMDELSYDDIVKYNQLIDYFENNESDEKSIRGIDLKLNDYFVLNLSNSNFEILYGNITYASPKCKGTISKDGQANLTAVNGSNLTLNTTNTGNVSGGMNNITF